MRSIKSDVLKNEREKQGMSLDDLAKKSRIDRQTIHRIESGNARKNRNGVIQALAKALKIEEGVLTGEVAPSFQPGQTNGNDELFSVSQLNLRVSNRARNALSLTVIRYHVSLAQIVEIAPLLFCWAAEQSLKQRRDRIADIEKRNGELWTLKAAHLHGRAFNNDMAEDTLEAERKSIAKNDVFGHTIDGDEFHSFLPDDYSEEKDNPFAVYLQSLTRELGDLASFEEWHPSSDPIFTVCRSQAVEYVAGDIEAADEILDGSVPLHKLPKELRQKENGEARAKWVREEAAAMRKSLLEKLNLSDLDI